MNIQHSKNKAFINIPDKKINDTINDILKSCEECSKHLQPNRSCNICNLKITVINRYVESNIPVMYWLLSMKDFKGNKILLDKYNEVTADLQQTYKDGVAMCFAGKHGCGKSYVLCNILKRAVEKNFNCLYVALSDIVASATSNNFDKFDSRKELISVDFLAIDEFDSRHMASEKGIELFGRQIEDVFRKRAENKLPTFMATNSPDIVSTFSGSIKLSIESLMHYVNIVPVIGQDFRKLAK